MKILNETTESIVNLKIDMSWEEIKELEKYYNEKCPDRIRTEIAVNWAVNDLLIKKIKAEKKKLKKKY